MTPEQIALVQSSFARVVPFAGTAAELFYGRLFELEPEVKPLFNSGLPDQGRKFMSMLVRVVGGLNNLETIVPAARALALRHAGYGVVPKQYESVGEALLWTLELVLGDGFTPDVRKAWEDAYDYLAGVMIAATVPEKRQVAMV